MSTSRPKVPEPYRKLAAAARKARWKITRHGSGHLRWQAPDGAVVTTPCSPGDRRGVLNSRAALRRAGLRKDTP